MRLITDLFAYCRQNLPSWNTISISGYHMREAGATAAEEIAFTLSHAVAYVEAAQAAGLAVDEFAPRVSFFFACHMDFFEEVAKFRAARRMWARIVRDRFHATDPRSQALRFHTQTGGVTLTAQQPLNNIVRTTLEAMSAVLGGTQSLHTNAYDEALGLPSQNAAEIALRTQQVIGNETAVPLVADPLGGSYYVENLTDRVEEEALGIMAEVDELGGAVACIESGWTQRRIADSAYRMQRRIEAADRVVVGVNKYTDTAAPPVEIMKIGPRQQAAQARALKKLRAARPKGTVERHLAEIERVAKTSDNLLPALKAALADYVTIGECCRVLRDVFGEYRPGEAA
jgi:methylmalonyl-CoA mutase N-terminal domain/subunit